MKKIILFILLPFILTGCYDKKELDDLAYAIAIGFDQGEENNLDITYQIAIPLKLSGNESKNGKENYTTYTVSAPSLYLGNSIINSKTSKEINLSNVKLILYSEELAKNDLSGHISELTANVDIRPKTTIAICKNKAQDFLKEVSPILESSTARFYELFLNSDTYTNMSISSELINFYTAAQSIDKDAHAVVLDLKDTPSNDEKNKSEAKQKESSPESNLSVTGIATFYGGKMIGEVPIEYALAHQILTNTLKRGTVGIPDINSPDEIVTFTLTPSRKSKINIHFKDDIPQIEITTFINAHMLSSESTTDYLQKENRNLLKKALEEKISTSIQTYTTLLKKQGSDIVGFGKYARKHFLTWSEFEKTNWKKNFKFSNIEINTKIDLNISETSFHRLPNV